MRSGKDGGARRKERGGMGMEEGMMVRGVTTTIECAVECFEIRDDC